MAASTPRVALRTRHALGRRSPRPRTGRAGPPSARRCGTGSGCGCRRSSPAQPGLRLARGAHGVADVLARPAAGVGQQLALRAEDLVGAPGLGAREGSADVELVRLAHADAVAARRAPFVVASGCAARCSRTDGRAAARRFVAVGRRAAIRWAPRASSAVRPVAGQVEVRTQPVDAALAAVAGLLVAAERAGRVEAVEGVRPHHAGAHGAHHLEDAAALLGPHAGRQAVRRVVRLLDRLLGRPEGEDRQHRAEDLLLRDAMGLATRR